MDKILIGVGALLVGVLVWFLTFGIGTPAEEPKSLQLLPDQRSFYMGIGDWPYDFTAQARNETFQLVDAHADMIVHEFDFGIPWPEALSGEPFHPNVEAEILFRIAQQQPDKKVLLTLSPQGANGGLAPYWGEFWNMAYPDSWGEKLFDDSDVITAFLGYAFWLVDVFQPDYLAFATEANAYYDGVNDPRFEQFSIFAAAVYESLKIQFPDLPVFMTFSTLAIEDESELELNLELTSALLPFSDFVAITAHPFWVTPPGNGMADPSQLPPNLFKQWADLAPEKPFAVAETSYPAENVRMHRGGELIVDIAATQNGQTSYIQWLLTEMNRLDAEFVVWFSPRDYDLGWERLEAQGEPQFTKLWRDTGLFNGQGQARPSLAIWEAWLGVSVAP